MQIAAVSALSGLEQSQSKLNTVAERVASGSSTDSVDLSSEAVSLIQAKNDFAANIDVLKVVDQIQKSLFDLVG